MATTDFLNPDVGALINLGVLGLMVVLALIGQIRFKPEHDEMKERLAAADAGRAKAEGQRDEAMEIAQEKIIPILVRFTDTTEALLPLIQALALETRRDTERRRRELDERD